MDDSGYHKASYISSKALAPDSSKHPTQPSKIRANLRIHPALAASQIITSKRVTSNVQAVDRADMNETLQVGSTYRKQFPLMGDWMAQTVEGYVGKTKLAGPEYREIFSFLSSVPPSSSG